MTLSAAAVASTMGICIYVNLGSAFPFKMKPCIQKTRTKPLIYGASFGFCAFMIEDLRLKTVYILRIFVKAITKLPTSSCAYA